MHDIPDVLKPHFQPVGLPYNKDWRWRTHHGFPSRSMWYVFLRASKEHNPLRFKFFSSRRDNISGRKDYESPWYTPEEVAGVWARCLMENRAIWEPEE